MARRLENGEFPAAFRFEVKFGSSTAEASFQEVSGLGKKIETDEVVEGGENRFVLKLPRKVTHTNLVLKRGVTSSRSELVSWCKRTLSGGLFEIRPKLVHVSLLDEQGEALHEWTFDNAYPVNWELGAFSAQENKLAIETIELAYTYANREC